MKLTDVKTLKDVEAYLSSELTDLQETEDSLMENDQMDAQAWITHVEELKDVIDDLIIHIRKITK